MKLRDLLLNEFLGFGACDKLKKEAKKLSDEHGKLMQAGLVGGGDYGKEITANQKRQEEIKAEMAKNGCK